METINNYDKLKQIDEESTPLPKEVTEAPTRAIPIDPDASGEVVDKAQIEAEIEIEKHGVPIIDVERPPVPEVKTDTTPYKKVSVTRKAKKSDGKEKVEESNLKEDREMKAYAEKLSIPKRISLLERLRKKLSDLSCKIKKFAFNTKQRHKRKKIKLEPHTHDDHMLPKDIRRVMLDIAKQYDFDALGREREFKRDSDRSSGTISMVRNSKTGVVVATPSVTNYKDELENKGENISDYEVVESKIKG